MPDPKFKWSPKRREYVYGNGRAVSPETLSGWIATAADNAEQRMRAIAQQYAEGKINHAEWVLQSKDEIRRGVRAMAQLANGGGLDKRQLGMVGAAVKQQFGFLAEFANAVEAGDVLLDQSLVARAGLYGSNHFTVYQNFSLAREKQAGVKFAKRTLSMVAMHCPQCPTYQTPDFVPINKIKPIGTDCQCRARCRCRISYRK